MILSLCQFLNTAANNFHAQELCLDDVPAAIALIQKVKKSACLSQPYHLKERNPDDLATDSQEGFPMIGIKDEKGALIAFATVSPTDSKNTVILRSVCVDPDRKGQKLGQKLVDFAINWAHKNDFDTLTAKVATNNTHSKKLFQNNGFLSQDEQFDDLGGYHYVMFSKPVSTSSLKLQAARPNPRNDPHRTLVA